MVGPSITRTDREKFLKRLKIGFAVLVGGSMALVTLWGGAELPLVVGVAVGTTAVGRLLAEFTFPDSIAETPYEDTTDRGPKPGVRTQRRRSESDEDGLTRATDGDGRRSNRE
ncbi:MULTISPECIES: hypothetical protein [Haloarcula]|uniref:Uncharacterized protein n=1 Tax=Haloarcula pellucida TaxID=1427151 RepID=A0A830GJ40_9EURY|nr:MULTISPECIES: hypothetical protein [Halomicroarcula]MBX0347653.1 hypothetical protein [Halomicroarcula pellucida]MDS0276413.1 hypothetical protein [Halomicroarcula sp. S1AR25-4]GGN89750.1 hypothetical protein GCM10009030_10790 [Halomicroarcula pellucida]